LDFGLRTILNLGHTFGHALEVAGNFEEIKHGEAVGIGLCMSARLSELLGMLPREDRGRIKDLVEAFGLPCCFPSDVNPSYLLEIMTRDKKNKSGRIAMILPTAIGKVERIEFKQEELAELFAKLRG
jgi:3-dehydroquinate synthase